ncbi:MAG: hypothetical protein EU530_03090 [Promethearchaeota archaeon]|nr:MAG: hypothetical protein EU530_03090 [Candidatus Lokiarchaeota archaeon]
MNIKSIGWKILHISIIMVFSLQIIYCLYVFFVVLNTGNFILFNAAASLDMDLLIKRRLYAIELWISIVGLVIYLAIVYKNQLSMVINRETQDRE